MYITDASYGEIFILWIYYLSVTKKELLEKKLILEQYFA